MAKRAVQFDAASFNRRGQDQIWTCRPYRRRRVLGRRISCEAKASDSRLRECNLNTQNRPVLGRRRTSIRASNGARDLGSISKRKMERRTICRDMPKKLRGDR